VQRVQQPLLFDFRQRAAVLRERALQPCERQVLLPAPGIDLRDTKGAILAVFRAQPVLNTITSTPLRALVAGTILGALSLGFTAPLHAGESSFVPQITVKYADLDLSNSGGAAALYGRIHSAASNICWRMYNSDVAYRAYKDACLKAVITDAVAKVNQPTLSVVYQAHYGATQPVVVATAQGR
jgi:UrcA family protein